ncbi:MAG: hypothetical protein NVSMB29_19440 [Candidatus Dormibacteria bacterium]
MTSILKLKTACLAALMVFAVPITAAAETAGATAPPVYSPANTAIAVNNKPGTSVFDLAFSIKFTTATNVQPVNLALALASCKSCQTVAIAIQVIIYTAGASVVAPVNAAVAVNYLCTLCDTLASAYQFVIGTAGPVRFTSQGRRAIRDIREQLEELKESQLTTAQINARVAALMARLANVLATQLVPVGKDHEGGYDTPHPAESSPSPSATATASPSSSPTATPAAGATRAPAASPTPSPTR